MKLNTLLTRIVLAISRIGADPGDPEDLRMQKVLMVGTGFMNILAATLWGLLYYAFGRWMPGSIPLAYAAFSLLSILFFGLTGRYGLFRFSQFVLILLLPFLLMLSLGGFVNSGAVILWSLLSPLSALLFDRPRAALGWLAAYLGLVALSGLLQGRLPAQAPMPPGIIIFFFVINIGAVSGIMILMLAYFVGQKNVFQEKSENLLLNILPREVAAILKDETRTIANRYEEASILFADMVNFTPMSAEMSPTAMVDLLNEIFSHFDDLVEQHGLEKIKTVGDCYMVGSGVPRPRPDHAQGLVELALEMQQYIREHSFHSSQPVSFRIGINSGAVMAGVIGRKKFIYDLWGDDVNLASRMESQGQPGVIQITRATYELVHDQFICEPRGVVNVKGKGEVEVWHVLGRRSAVQAGTLQQPAGLPG
ncbi:MAG TPA: adenylate/guanylate cyclase domain-containing protein [Anaerolineales bacterium]